MKLKDNLVLRQIAQNWVVMPLAERTLDFSGILMLNDSGAMLWKVLETECSLDALVNALTSEYTVSEEEARTDAAAFLDKLRQAGCIEE